MPELTERGLATFLQGFSATCSLTHPFPVRQVSPTLWILADAPRKNARTTEIIAYHADPEEVLRSTEVGPHMLCVLLESSETVQETRQIYDRLGYHSLHAEYLFVLPLEHRITSSAYPVRRVVEELEVEVIRKAERDPLLLPEHLNDPNPPFRLYGAFDDGKPLGWVRSVSADAENHWVANLFVHPDYRRRGIGSSLMSALLDDDADLGAKYSVLIASETGAQLYPRLGYSLQGILLIFSPREKGGLI